MPTQLERGEKYWRIVSSSSLSFVRDWLELLADVQFEISSNKHGENSVIISSSPLSPFLFLPISFSGSAPFFLRQVKFTPELRLCYLTTRE